MIGFVRIQLRHCDIVKGTTRKAMGIGGKVEKDELDRSVSVAALTERENQQIQVLLDGGCEKDMDGNEWTIEKIFDWM